VPGRNTGFNTDSNYAVSYGYDNTGRFNTVSWNVGTHSDTVQYGYEPNSHLLQTTIFGSGASTAYTFEPNRDLKTSVLNNYNSTTISQYDYTHDNIGRRTSATMTGDVFENPSLPPAPDELLMVDTGTTTSAAYSANDLNQYTSVDTNGSAVNPVYDEDGSLTDDGTFTYVWNGENRLITITPKTPAVDDKKLEFLYDYMGRRVRKITTEWDGATWQPDETALFVYDGWNLIEELDGSGVTTASYVHGLDLSQSLQGTGGIGGILARIDHGASKVHIYFYDANGNVGQIIDSSDGSIAAAYEYAPFGGMTSAMGAYAEANPFRFSSRYADDVTGLYYYGYRYYSPMFGRWISRDPIGEDGGLNLYAIIYNDTINLTDLLGLSCTRLLIYTTSLRKSDEYTFQNAAKALSDEYKKRKDGHRIVLAKVTTGAELVAKVNEQIKDSIKSLDIFSHSNLAGIHIAKELSAPEKSPIPKRMSHILMRDNITTEDAEYMEESYHGLYSGRLSAQVVGIYYNQKSGDGIAYLGSINFNNFTNDAAVEFHGCKTAQEIKLSEGVTIDNFAMKFSSGLYGAGKTNSKVIGHVYRSSPTANHDYRKSMRRVYQDGKLLKEIK
jgi:RHS repeat-associated protein